MNKQDESLKWHKRALNVIPGGTQVLSKQYGRVPYGVAPAFISHGKGSRIWDVDGNEYIDWSASLGPVTIGYERFKCIMDGFEYPIPYRNSCLPMNHPTEVELAERLVDVIPCAKPDGMVRFFKSGSDACSAAVRLARAVTGRKWVVCYGYHGWHDWYAFTLPSPRNDGCLDGQFVAKMDYGEISYEDNDLACIIVEPMSRLCPEKASPGFLKKLRDFCNRHDTILIFDEIIMGFRHALAGGQEYYGVTPDLATYSKGMANGYPISALIGKREIMKEISQLQVSGTFFGDIMGMNMALNVLNFYQNPKSKVIEHLWWVGNKLCDGIAKLIVETSLTDIVYLKGFGPWSSFVWSDRDYEAFFLQEIFDRGVFYNRDHFAMYSHTEKDIEHTLNVYGETMRAIAHFRKVGLNIKIEIRGELDRGLFP